MRLAAIIFLILLLICFATPASAAAIMSGKYSTILSKINAGNEGLVYSIDAGKITLTYRITTFDTTTFNYSIRVFTNYHSNIFMDIPLTAQTRSFSTPAAKIPDGIYWINLMRTARDEDKYCALVGYPCEVSKNLDMIRVDLNTTTKIRATGDAYQIFVGGAIDRSAPIKGAAWTTSR